MGNCFQKHVNKISSTNNTSTLANIENADEKKEPMIGNRPSMDVEGGGGGGESGGTGETVTSNMKIFTFAELKKATRNFRPDAVLGEGGFGSVYKGWVDGETYAPSKAGVGIAVAVKRSSYNDDAHLKEWQARMSFLEKCDHPNLVGLLGYGWKDGHFFHVCEYMENGSLENYLFKRSAIKPLPWNRRINIAIEAGRGLVFMHIIGRKTIVYEDFTSSKILLDKSFIAKLSNFGLVNLAHPNGKSHVSTDVFCDYHYSPGVDTYDYTAPKANDDLYVKKDVYSLGVVLLEMITGLRVLDKNRPSSQYNLVEWARPALPHKKTLRKIIDPRLENNYPTKGAIEVSRLILSCLEENPKKRPPMEEVIARLEYINTIETKPKVSTVKTTHK